MNGTVSRLFCAAAAGLALAASGLAGARASGTGRLQATSGPDVQASFEPAAASFRSPAKGVVLGGAGCTDGHACRARLAATADGGSHWHYVTAPTVSLYGAGVARVLFATARDGWLWGPVLWSTHDGGGHWRKLSLGGAVESMAASAGTVYAAVAPRGGGGWELFRSLPGRDTWARVGRMTATDGSLAVSGRAAWFGNSTHLWATADGVHWHRYPFRCPGASYYGLVSMAAASASDVLFLCAGNGAVGHMDKEVARSADSGRTVHLAGRAPFDGDEGVIAVPPSRSAVITLATSSFSSWLDRSADGGKTWKQVGYADGGAGWSSLSYVSRTVGWVVAAGRAKAA